MNNRRPHRPRRWNLTRSGASSVTAPLPAIAALAAVLVPHHAGHVPAITSADTTVPDAAVIEQAKEHIVREAPRGTLDAAMTTYKVRAGDSISEIAARKEICGKAQDWTGIFAASRKLHLTGPDADQISVGQSLAIDCRYDASQLRYAGQPASLPVVQESSPKLDPWDGQHHECGDGDGDGMDMPCSELHHGGGSVQARAVTVSPGGSFGNVNPKDYSGFQACVIARESGGNSQVMNSSGHYGLYQFSSSTWQAYGGSAADFGHASAAEQTRVFDNAMAQGGQSNWSPYDGC
jgi:Transglycosylase-like domain